MEWVKAGAGGVEQRTMNEGTVWTCLGENLMAQVALVLLA